MTLLEERILRLLKERFTFPTGDAEANQIINSIPSHRLQMIQALSLEYISVHTSYFDGISNALYTVSGNTSEVVVYLHPDRLLWLDDHASDIDFEMFYGYEDIESWFPHRLEAITHLLVKTKFAYLLRPQLIHTALEIPSVPDDKVAQLAQVMDKDTLEEELLDRQRRLKSISSNIRTPYLEILPNARRKLEFFIWTRSYGTVFSIRCFFEKNGAFRYEGSQLITGVGDYFPNY